MAQRSSSMATVSVEDAASNSRDDQQSLSAMMGRALQVRDSVLSQLKQNETLICELQGRAENGVSGVLGEQMTLDPGSSSLRGCYTAIYGAGGSQSYNVWSIKSIAYRADSTGICATSVISG